MSSLTATERRRRRPIFKTGWLLAAALVVPTFPRAVSPAELYGYDANGRLTSITYEDDRFIAYRYDANGNIVAVTTGVQTVFGSGFE